MTTEFAPPGPGRWELDRSHFPGGATPISQELMESAMESGMRRVMAELGVPADCVQARFVNGFMYTRLRPLVGADRPSKRLPPKIVLKVVSRLHPEFRRRAKQAAETERLRPSTAIAAKWATTIRPELVAQNLAFQSVDIGSVSDQELSAHLAALIEHLRANAELHFWLHGHDLGPIARFLHSGLGWGFTATEVFSALGGASPSTSEPIRRLVRLRALIDSAGGRPTSLDQVRTVSREAATELDGYLRTHGSLLTTGYDVTALTLNEMPGAVLQSILHAREPDTIDSSAVITELRLRVAASDQSRFDAEVADARAVMDMRDDNGPLTFEWPAGLLRMALLEAGRRLTRAGRMAEPEHAFELSASEANNPFAKTSPSAAELSARAQRRTQLSLLDPPVTLGPEEPQPPLDVLPPVLANAVAMVQAALTQLDMNSTDARVDPLTGAGVGQAVYRGRVCRAATAEEALDLLEPGDVLVVRATSPAFNVVLTVAGAIVTADGGLMSHAAVLARELGIPAVIGARGSFSLPHGAEVEVDPILGVVRVLSA